MRKLGGARVVRGVARDALRLAGMREVGKRVLVLPLATGMTMTLVLSSMRSRCAREGRGGELCDLVSIGSKDVRQGATRAGLKLVVIEPVLNGDQLETNVSAIERAIDEVGRERLVAVVTSTSCFAPRACDDVEAAARLCRDKDVGHVINNAYGVQSKELCARVNKAWTVGRVDAVVQSTDKNFLVPSAARSCAPGKRRNYGGRRRHRLSRTRVRFRHLGFIHHPLSMGEKTWTRLLDERESLYAYMRARTRKSRRRGGRTRPRLRKIQSPWR